MGAGGPPIRYSSDVELGRQGISHRHREIKYYTVKSFAPPVDGKQGQLAVVDALLGGVLDPDPPPVLRDTVATRGLSDGRVDVVS